MTLLGQLKSNKGDNLGGCSDQVFWWSRASVESMYSCRGQSGTGRNPVSPARPAAHGPGQQTHGCQTQVLTVFTVRGDPESVEECPLGIHFRGRNCEECVCSLNGARGVSAGSPCGAGPVRWFCWGVWFFTDSADELLDNVIIRSTFSFFHFGYV